MKTAMAIGLWLSLATTHAFAQASVPADATGGGLRARLEQMREASRQQRAVALPAGARALRDVAYGADAAQRFDLYLPADAGKSRPLPVIFYVHGGGWANGDKTNPGIENKLAFWLPKGYALVSADYRMLPEAKPLEQARDIAAAVDCLAAHAPQWNLDPARIVLMGHSAGAHLVALLGADPRLLRVARPRGVVSLDSGAIDVARLMSQRFVPQLFKDAFGNDPAYWAQASPFDRLGKDALPMLLVCSSSRRVPMPPCDEARAFARKAQGAGVPMQVLPEALNHMQINRDLGLSSDYTAAVSDYIDVLVR